MPIFQEQVMQVSHDRRRLHARRGRRPAPRHGGLEAQGGLEKYCARILQGMQERGYEEAFAEQIYEQIKGFSDYGFPESHAASFAPLAMPAPG